MKAVSTFVGISGATYGFAEIEQAWLLPRTAGNFIYARQNGGAPTVLFVGGSDDLVTDARSRWSEAVSQHGATHLYVRRIVSVRGRQLAEEDLVQGYAPVMNDEVWAATGTYGR